MEELKQIGIYGLWFILTIGVLTTLLLVVFGLAVAFELIFQVRKRVENPSRPYGRMQTGIKPIVEALEKIDDVRVICYGSGRFTVSEEPPFIHFEAPMQTAINLNIYFKSRINTTMSVAIIGIFDAEYVMEFPSLKLDSSTLLTSIWTYVFRRKQLDNEFLLIAQELNKIDFGNYKNPDVINAKHGN